MHVRNDDSKFQVLFTPIRCRKYSYIRSKIKCVCILHNFIGNKEEKLYITNLNENVETIPVNVPHTENNLIINENTPPLNLRNYLSNYF